MILNRLTLLLSVFVLFCFVRSGYAASQSTLSVGRYLTAIEKPFPEQEDLLLQTFQVRFPKSIKTIEEAMGYLLRFSGYTLVNAHELKPAVSAILSRSLPEVNRTLGPMNLKKGLLTLAGEPFGLLVDPVHRLVSFRLQPAYSVIYQVTQK